MDDLSPPGYKSPSTAALATRGGLSAYCRTMSALHGIRYARTSRKGP